MHTVADTHCKLSDDEWANVLKRSVHERVIDGVTFPAFPPEAVQSQFVGSSNEDSLGEALQFYRLVKGYSKALGMEVRTGSKMLDFGCGWGRYLRFFWRDIAPENLYGVDVDPEILDICRKAGIQANLDRIIPDGELPFPDNTFSHIIAYSVFTHLPENVQLHWLKELSRVARPGCVFVCTTEPRRFLEFVEAIPDTPPSQWHAGLKRAAGDIKTAKEKFDSGQFVYLPTGGGKYRSADIYGDAIIPEAYIRSIWDRHFATRAYIDDSNRFRQAVVVNQKR